MRWVYLCLLVSVLAAGFIMAAGSAVDSHCRHTAPESVINKVESLPQEIAAPHAGPFSKLRGGSGGEKECTGPFCHRHEQELKMQVEIQQPKQDEQPETPPLAIPLLVMAIVFVVGGGMYYAGWFTH